MKRESYKKEILLLILLLTGLLFLISLVGYNPNDPSFFSIGDNIPPKNYVGFFGSYFSDLLFQVFGFAAWLIAFYPLYILVYIVLSKDYKNRLLKITLGYFFLVILITPLMYYTFDVSRLNYSPGGFIGKFTGDLFVKIFGIIGSYIILIGLFLISLIYTTGLSLFTFLKELFLFVKSFFIYEGTHEIVEDEKDINKEDIDNEAVEEELTEADLTFHPDIQELHRENEQLKEATGFSFDGDRDFTDDRPFTIGNDDEQENKENNSTIGTFGFDKDKNLSNEDSIDNITMETVETEYLPPQNISEDVEESGSGISDDPESISLEEGKISEDNKDNVSDSIEILEPEKKDEVPQKSSKKRRKKGSHFEAVPKIDFLEEPENLFKRDDPEELKRKASLLQEKLREFKVDGKVTGIQPGPIITLYEFVPAPGIKVSKITNLVDDLSIALKVPKVRAAVLSERGAVGIEVPNQNRRTVKIREIIDSSAYTGKKHLLPMVLGLDISGRPVVEDLAGMPHLLVAGSTGSGKSVGINSLLLGMLYRHTPETLKLVLVDPKMVELSVYSDIPHLLVPVISDSERAVGVLKGIVSEMDKRYSLLQLLKVRNINQFNKKVKELEVDGETWVYPDNLFLPADIEKNEEGKIKVDPMPYIVVIVDEYADLMYSTGKKVEEFVARIAQKARAAGIHMILATQRPESKVVTGIIKSNLPARISFFVRSKIDSRVILDDGGAAQLLGKGDMLFLHPGKKDLMRIQGPFVTLQEVNNVVSFWKTQGEPDYRMDMIMTEDNDGGVDIELNGDQTDEDKDELYYKGLDIALRDGFVSASKLQRELKIGYNRASRYIMIMEREGVVGKADGAKPRKVLINKEDI